MKAILTAMALICASAAAQAATSGSKEEQAACRPDVRKFCSHVSKGDDAKYKECLQAHFSELSQKCQQVLMKHQNQQ
ncbi:MAG: hypothetical protein KGM15_02205 [Pseudomonadota bacterium]|nr:hypothetical protein [Pseudomonadota bacterium]